MEFVVHPREIGYGEYTFEVLSIDPLSDEQAANVVRQFCRMHKLKKKDRGKILRITTRIDHQSARMFGD